MKSRRQNYYLSTSPGTNRQYFKKPYKKTIVRVLAMVTVFITTYMLILPALTLEKYSAAGMAGMDSQAVLDCLVCVHEHTEDCYDKDHNLVCGQADYVVHTHDSTCYDKDGNLVCPLPEIEEHKHTDACYQKEKILVCGQQEHRHTDACYEEVAVSTEKELACGYSEGEVLTPADENGEGEAVHHHDESCYETVTQTERRLTCGLEEHSHDDSCYETQKVLTCDKLELHTHTEDCYEKGPKGESPEKMGWVKYEKDAEGNKVLVGDPEHLVCGKLELKEHRHGNACFKMMPSEEKAEETGSEEPAPEEGGQMDFEETVPEEDGKTDSEETAPEEGGQTEETAAGSTEYVDGSETMEPGETAEASSEAPDADTASIPHQYTAEEVAGIAAAEEPSGETGDLADAADFTAGLGEEIQAIFDSVITIDREVLASDGHNYRVSVTCGKEAGIPEGAELEVSEIEEGSSAYGRSYEEYVNSAEKALGWEEGSAGYVRLFDIKIVDGEDHSVIYQPAEGTTVDVKIELADAESGGLNVVHFADASAEGDVVDAETDGKAVDFKALGFSVYAVVTVSPGELDSKSYGVINTKDGSKPSGIAMMSTAQNNGTKLQGKSTTVRVNTVNRTDYVYVAENSNITMWTFHEDGNGNFYITAGNGKYLKVTENGVSLSDEPDSDCVFTVTQGTGSNAGKYRFSTGKGVLRINNSSFERAAADYNGADAWMNLAELSELNEDDFVTYTARKVSISEAAGEVNNDDLVVIYTRIWNETTSKYDYYAIDYDGKLVRAYESGDTISWVGSQVNTMLWTFTEYYYENSDTPNGYYELQNNYSGKYIAPKTSNGRESFLSGGTIGVNLNGRGSGDYYTTILAWDDYYYASLKVDEDNIKLLSSTLSQASDFYFAKMSVETVTTEVTTVSTLDSTQYGITLKMQDFGEHDQLEDGRSEEMDSILGPTKYEQWTGTKNLLKKYIAEESDYPEATYGNAGKTLGDLFSHTQEVNQQFLTSTYYETGYFEYDSTRNFAHLIQSEKDPWFGIDAPNGETYKVGDFVVYGQLGTSAEGNKETLKHGQFLPYNDIIEGFKTDEAGHILYDEDGNPIPITKKISKKYQNTTDIHAQPLSSLDPNYGEALYEIEWDKTHEYPKVDHFFGMEMSAAFMQSADGVDAWGHDLIFEFSGDDDFWLYVDDMLVLDLGGIHSALDGSINFRTGRIVENGTEYWLRDRFEEAYREQHAGEPDLDAKVQTWLKGIFKVETSVGEDGEEQEIITSVFKDYSTHTMRMFYLERGAGASNLHMRFNLSEYKEGRVQLEKIVSGAGQSGESFPFQIWYMDPKNHVMVLADNNIRVRDSKDDTQVPYSGTYSVQAGGDTYTYSNVFSLKAGQTVNIDLPDEATEYYIKECTMDSPATYEWVKINDVANPGSPVKPQEYNNAPVREDTVIQANGRLDFNTTTTQVSERKKVVYENHVNENAKNNLTITKRLWQDEDRTREIFSGDGPDADNTEFMFRVYIGKEDGTYTFYKNSPYRVKNPAGEYCYYYNGGFVSTGQTDFSQITDDLVNYDPEILLGDTLQQRCTFHTGNGSISKIKAGYTVEIPDLMNGTPYIVLERDSEVPSGYDRLGYEKNSEYTAGNLLEPTGTEGKETSRLIEGVINGGQSVTVHNQHGYTLIADKVWSDAAFMVDHDEIYFAVYLKDEDGSSVLVEDSVRQLGKTGTSLSWFFSELEEGKNLNNYEVYEVKLRVPEGSTLGQVAVDSSGKVTGYTIITGGTQTEQAVNDNNIIKIREGGILTAGGTTNEHGYSESMEYTAGYSREVLTAGPDGKYPNIRRDTVTNSRAGIKIIKKDLANTPLEGAVFTLSNNSENDPEKTKKFTSNEEGLVVVAYLTPGEEYTLEEISAPYGYQALIDSLTIRVDDNGKVFVNDSETSPEDDYYSITQVPNPTAANMPAVTIFNKNLTMKAIKIDSYTGRPMAGVEFELYKEVYASTNGMPDPTRPRPDYTPMEGYERLVTDSEGVIPGIVLRNSANPNGLTEGHYYLREKETPSGYLSLGYDLRINITSTGLVSLQSATRPAQSGKDWIFGTVSSDVAEIGQTDDGPLQITVKNTPKDPLRLKKVEMGSNKTLANVRFELYRSNQIGEDGLPKQGETPIISDTTDGSGILNLGGLEGLYFLFETETLPGYNLLPGPVVINAWAGENKITASLNGKQLTCRKVKDNNNKDVWEFTVENNPGVELPASGGPGTRIFYLLGSLLLIGAGVMLVTRHRTAGSLTSF